MDENKYQDILKKIAQESEERRRKLASRPHNPYMTNKNQTFKVNAPSRLSSLGGDRGPGPQVRQYSLTKPPKRRFHIGQLFEYEGTVWELIYMYRIKSEPGVWYHCLEEQRGLSPNQEFLKDAFVALGAGATTPRVVFEEFPSHSEANTYFSDIYRKGDGTTKSTQQLLGMKLLGRRD